MSAAPTRLTTSDRPASQVDADWLIVGVTAEADSTLEPPLAEPLQRLRLAEDLTGKHLELVTLHHPNGLAARRVLFVGLGPKANISRAVLHDAYAAALRAITGRHFRRVAIAVPASTGVIAPETAILGIGAGAIQGSVGPDLRKAQPSRHPPDEIVLVGRDVSAEAVRRAAIEGTAITLARELVNLPPCDLHPESFAARAEAIGHGVTCEIWDERRLEAERMGAILGVARGADRPPRLAILRYQNGGETPALAFVGKGVTFDSGGLSLKTNDQMVDMKCDMAGAATVLAAVQAVAELGLPVNLLAIMPLVENMPGGRSMKLGDVLRARNGTTIEVLNTDAEGRLILADALAYAAEQRPGHIVDLATLTGACMVALGTEIAGLMSNDVAWGEQVQSAAARAGERLWPLPMDKDFEEALQSKVADIKNVGGNRYGGAILGAKFLQPFVGSTPWAHLDIAGPAWSDRDSPTRDAGGTGAYVRSLVELAAGYLE